MEKFGKFILGTLLIVISVFLEGWVISVLWKWFIASTFSVQTISILQAIGMSLFISLYKKSDNIGNDFKDFTTSILNGISKLAVTFITGYILHLFL